MKIVWVYVITNLVNEKRYVGKSVNPVGRWKSHISKAKKNAKTVIAKALMKHGVENFTFKIIEECENDSLASQREIFWIAEWKTQDQKFGYNRTKGGDGTVGLVFSEEHRRKISEAGKNRIITDEYREKMRVALTGRVITEEHKKKISEGWAKRTEKRKPWSPDVIKRRNESIRLAWEKRKQNVEISQN